MQINDEKYNPLNVSNSMGKQKMCRIFFIIWFYLIVNRYFLIQAKTSADTKGERESESPRAKYSQNANDT